MAEADALIEMAGAELTAKVAEAIVEQPLEFVPVTEYTVVTPGLTVILDVVAPLLHK
jgi:hypothetical protein